MTLKTKADWNELLQTIRALAERTKMKRRQAIWQGEFSMKEIEQLKARVDELEKAVQMLTEIVENLVKQEAKASKRKRWLVWLK
jgi:CRISPR/Cas system endoribonuclease Cas6 (RAMP superfamily)